MSFSASAEEVATELGPTICGVHLGDKIQDVSRRLGPPAKVSYSKELGSSICTAEWPNLEVKFECGYDGIKVSSLKGGQIEIGTTKYTSKSSLSELQQGLTSLEGYEMRPDSTSPLLFFFGSPDAGSRYCVSAVFKPELKSVEIEGYGNLEACQRGRA